MKQPGSRQAGGQRHRLRKDSHEGDEHDRLVPLARMPRGAVATRVAGGILLRPSEGARRPMALFGQPREGTFDVDHNRTSTLAGDAPARAIIDRKASV